jgi:osmotically-inducible protein OsmY
MRHDELACRVSADLSASNFPRLRHVSVEAHWDTVTLRGELASFYERQIAVARAERVPGVTRVIDHLRVEPS